MKRTVEINVVVVIAIEKIADVERAAYADEIADQIRMAKGDVGGVIRAETRAANGHAMAATFTPREIEHIADDHIFISVVRFHSIGRMNFLVVETFQIDRVRAINGDFASIDIARD